MKFYSSVILAIKLYLSNMLVSQITCLPSIWSLQKKTIHKSVIKLSSFTILNLSSEKYHIRNHMVAFPCVSPKKHRKCFLLKMWMNVSFLPLKCVFILILKRVVRGARRVRNLLDWNDHLKTVHHWNLFCPFTADLVQNRKLRHRWKSSALANREFYEHIISEILFQKTYT